MIESKSDPSRGQRGNKESPHINTFTEVSRSSLGKIVRCEGSHGVRTIFQKLAKGCRRSSIDHFQSTRSYGDGEECGGGDSAE